MTSDSPRCAPIFTRVGHADWGDNRFQGCRLLGELVGTAGFWSMIALAVGGPRLGAAEEALLDEASTCAFAADPRIWPLKITRLVAAYGNVYPALAVGYLPMEGAPIGPPVGGVAARLLASLRRELGDQCDSPAAIREVVMPRLEAGEKLGGFGAPFRDRDERFEALRQVMRRHGREDGPHWRLLLQLDRILSAERGLPANIAGGHAAMELDLGFTAEQATVLPVAYLLSNFLANAVEGAAQAPPVLRELPHECVSYRGPAPRTSPRAQRE